MQLIAGETSAARDGGESNRMPPALTAYLRAFVVRQRRTALFHAAGWAVAFLVAWVLIACVLDRFLQLPRGVRLVVLLTGVAGALLFIARHVLRMFADIDYGHAADRVERAYPVYGERLRTVVSQASHGSASSPDMLRRLTDDVLGEIRHDRPVSPQAQPTLRAAWITAGAALAVALLVSLIPTLEMPRLLKRLALPLAHVPPVTTTRIDVRPGDVSLHRGEPLEIRARVRRLERGGVDLFTSEDGGSNWSRVPMLPVREDEYTFSLSAVDRGMRYYLSGGDATTETFTVEVLRAPAVVEYRVRYDYPLYTERSAVTLRSNDGVIDAVVGTRVQVEVVATEPLQSAVLLFGDERRVMAMAASADPHIAAVQFTIDKPERADLELRSKGGLSSGTLKNALTINAVADREPLVRVLQPLDDLRLHPRDVVGIQYQAIDDYGVLYLAGVVQTNSGASRELPIRRRGDLRRQEGEYFLDLATFDLRMGDVVTVSLLAQDGLGRRAQTESRNILISPRSIDINTYLRIAEMRQASRLAATTRDETRRAITALDQALRRADGPSSEQLSARARAGEALTNAVESALLSRQALLRAVAKSESPVQTLVLARCVDRASIRIVELERVIAMDAAGEREANLLRDLRPRLESATRAASETKTLAEAEQAAAILAERSNVRLPSTRPAERAAAERLAETLRRAEQEIASDVIELGLDPHAANLDELLQRLIDAGTRVARGVTEPDFATAAEAWVAQLRRSAVPLDPLAERLAAAASVEAVRPDGNPIIARDLQLASRATLRLTQSMLSWPEADRVFISHPVDEYPMAVRAVQREHALLRAGAGAGGATIAGLAPQSPEAQQVARDGAAGRAKLGEWATRVETSTGSEIAGDIMDEEELAMVASAETAMRHYDAASLTDRRLVEGITDPADAKRVAEIGVAMQGVQEIDRLASEQKNLAAQTAGLHDEERAAAMARDQENIARHIEMFHSKAVGGGGTGGSSRTTSVGAAATDSRRRATEAVQRVQEQLAHVPQRLTVAQEAAEAYRLAVDRADQARWRAEGADDEQRPAAERAVEIADRAAREAGDRMASAIAYVRADVFKRMATTLDPFQPETSRAIDVLVKQLAPAAENFDHVARGGERASVGRAAQRVRTAIETCQSALSDAQARLIENDPVVAAHWFAEAAARALAERPPDVPKAHRHQTTASVALDRAWQNAVRDVSTERLALAPGYKSILRPGAASGEMNTGVFRPFGELVPGLRQWGFLRSQPLDSVAAPVQESESPGYQDQLRVYFETLSKAQQQQQK